MKTLILNTATRMMMGLLLVFSIFLLLRGHNLPGGGFAGGLVAASAFALKALAFDSREARRLLRVEPHTLVAIGLAVALVSGVIAWFAGAPFLTGIWLENPVPVIGHLGTPLLFDVGVYIVVMGISLLIIFGLAEAR